LARFLLWYRRPVRRPKIQREGAHTNVHTEKVSGQFTKELQESEGRRDSQYQGAEEHFAGGLWNQASEHEEEVAESRLFVNCAWTARNTGAAPFVDLTRRHRKKAAQKAAFCF
jgi:hypothetical protein